MARKRRVFVVLSGWWFFNDEYTAHGDDRPVKAFSDRAQAEAYRQDCEQRERARQDPEDPGGTSFQVVEMAVEV
jgi:hypothetical protein